MLIPQIILEPFGVIGMPSICISAPTSDGDMLVDLHYDCTTITNFIGRNRHQHGSIVRGAYYLRLATKLLTKVMKHHRVHSPHAHVQHITTGNTWTGMSFAFTFKLHNGRSVNRILDLPFTD